MLTPACHLFVFIFLGVLVPKWHILRHFALLPFIPGASNQEGQHPQGSGLSQGNESLPGKNGHWPSPPPNLKPCQWVCLTVPSVFLQGPQDFMVRKISRFLCDRKLGLTSLDDWVETKYGAASILSSACLSSACLFLVVPQTWVQFLPLPHETHGNPRSLSLYTKGHSIHVNQNLLDWTNRD